MIRFVCPCGKQLQAHDENAGKAVLCPECKRQIKVPAAPPPPASIQPVEPASQPSAEPRVQKTRPAPREEPEEVVEEEADDRPRRRREAAGSSGKAIASLILGIASLCGCTCLTGLPSILLGILSLRDIGRSAGTLTGKPMAIIGIVLSSLGTLCWPIVGIPAWFKIGSAKEQVISKNNLLQMGLAMHNYHDVNNGQFPPAAIGDPRQAEAVRKPNLSWRVAILPYIEQQGLYRQFKLDEPWDGPNNIKLLGQMPKIYKLPNDDKTKPDHTHYLVFVGNGAAFDRTRGHRIPADFPDGTSNTILIATAEKAVPWTKPEDIDFNPNAPIRPLLSTYFSSGCQVVLADGSVRMLSMFVSENTLKNAVIRNDGNVLGLDW